MQPEQSHWIAESGGASLRDITLGALLREQAERHARRPAILFEATADNQAMRWTYAELDGLVDQVAGALIAAGVARRDRIAVMAPNRPEWILLEYAIARVGAVLVTVNPAFRQSELDYLLRQGRVNMLFAVGEHRGYDLAGMIEVMTRETDLSGGSVTGSSYPDLREIIQIGSVPIAGARSYGDFVAAGSSIDQSVIKDREASVQSRDIVQIQYTSGTTGQPKGAMLTHFGTVNNAMLAGQRAGYCETDVMVSAMPFFHTAGCVCNVIGMAAVGGCLVAMEQFDAARMLDLIEAQGGTVTNAVPTMYVRMLQDGALIAGQRNLASWRIAYTGGTSIPERLMRDIREHVGADPAIIMGMTECSPIITQTLPADPFDRKVSTAGVPLPHVEIRICDVATGQTVPLGVEGELLIRGFLVMAGYFDMPERTAQAIDSEGWLHSGDLGVLDQHGYLRIVGRIKDMIIRGGENIYPVEIEEHLMQYESVAEAQVVGIPDVEFGEEIFAFVVPKPGQQFDSQQLRDWCRQTLARHKLPRYVMALPNMPQTANGKVRKIELRDLAQSMIDQGALS